MAMPTGQRAPHPTNSLGLAEGTLAPGVRVGGAGYMLKRMLGRGAFSETWLAWDRKLEQDVALKVLPQRILQDANLLEHLKLETQRNQQLAHPAIARILGFVQDYTIAAIAMEYVEGWSLAALKVDKLENRYSLEESTPWIRTLCAALDYAHQEAGILHLDLKPANLMLNEREQLKVTDFGLAQRLRGFAAQTDPNRIAATLGFMSPQQALGEKPSVLDDVYSLGATIYDLLTGSPPFYKGQVLAQVCERTPPTMTERLRELGSQESIPLVVEDSVAQCLAKDPAKRPQTISEVLRLLERAEVPAPAVSAGSPKHDENQTSSIVAAPPQETASDPGAPASLPASVPVTELVATAADAPTSEESSPAAASLDNSQSEAANDTGAQTPGLEEPEAPAPTETAARVEFPAEVNALDQIATSAPRVRDGMFFTAAALCLAALLGTGAWLWTTRGGKGPAPSSLAGSLDSSFNPGTNADHEVRVALVQPDNKILIGGMFTRFGEGRHRGLARLNPDGSVDSAFTATAGGDVHALALQADGKIIIAGEFAKVNQQARRRIARLNPDGTLDETFSPNAAVNGDVRAALVQPDGKIVIAGSFELAAGKRLPRIARFNADGTLDSAFNPGSGAPAIVWSLALQPDGKILAAGNFTFFNQKRCGHIVRLNPDGGVDTSFTTGGGADAPVYAVALQSDGKILIGGDFVQANKVERNRVARLNPDGSLDPTFNPGVGPNTGVRCLAVQPDGKILIGGIFISVQGAARSRIARLKADGSLDPSFDPSAGANEVVRWIGLQPDGRILLAGGFRSFAGVERGRIARLRGESKDAVR